MATREEVDQTVVYHNDVAQANKMGVDVDEVAATRISEADMMRKSAEAFSMRPGYGLLVIGYMFAMGCNQAGYGVDWGVISGINSNDRWHDYYCIGIGIQRVGYKIWAMYIFYNFVQVSLSYYVFPETSKLNLEEIVTIFETSGAKPVKLSIKIADVKAAKRKLDLQNATARA